MALRESDDTSSEVVDLLVRRYDFLAILDTESYNKRTLQERLDVSRSTVDRAVRELQAASLVTRTEHGYRTTLYGYTLLAIYESILDNIERVRRAKNVLSVLPPDVDFTFDMLVNADVYIPENPTAHIPDTRLTELIERATSVKALVYNHTAPEVNKVIYSQIVNSRTNAEIILRQELYSYLESTYTDRLRNLLKEDGCSIYVTEQVPYGLLVFEIDGAEYMALIVYGKENTLRGIIVNDKQGTVRWANGVFEDYRVAATRVDSVQSPGTDSDD